MRDQLFNWLFLPRSQPLDLFIPETGYFFDDGLKEKVGFRLAIQKGMLQLYLLALIMRVITPILLEMLAQSEEMVLQFISLFFGLLHSEGDTVATGHSLWCWWELMRQVEQISLWSFSQYTSRIFEVCCLQRGSLCWLVCLFWGWSLISIQIWIFVIL